MNTYNVFVDGDLKMSVSFDKSVTSNINSVKHWADEIVIATAVAGKEDLLKENIVFYGNRHVALEMMTQNGDIPNIKNIEVYIEEEEEE